MALHRAPRSGGERLTVVPELGGQRLMPFPLGLGDADRGRPTFCVEGSTSASRLWCLSTCRRCPLRSTSPRSCTCSRSREWAGARTRGARASSTWCSCARLPWPTSRPLRASWTISWTRSGSTTGDDGDGHACGGCAAGYRPGGIGSRSRRAHRVALITTSVTTSIVRSTCSSASVGGHRKHSDVSPSRVPPAAARRGQAQPRSPAARTVPSVCRAVAEPLDERCLMRDA